MTIDPTSFQSQGKPTREQVRVVWDAMAKPSSRKVADIMTRRGFNISWRSVARWAKNEWREDLTGSGARPLAEKGQVRGVKQALKTEIAKIDQATLAEAGAISTNPDGIEAAIASPPNLDEYALIAKRQAELLLLTEAELDELEAKSRKVMNILLAEQAAKRAHVMVLIPKETGGLVTSLAEAQKVPLGAGRQAPGDDARTIDGTLNSVEPLNPLSSAINKFLADEEVA